MTERLLAAVACLALGCGDAGSAADASTDASTDARVVTPSIAPPADPRPPVFAPCPDGFTELSRLDGTIACEPFSDTDTGCEDGFVRFPGEAACRAHGSPCPLDGVPVDLPPTADVIHVRAGESGDGSLANPFGTIEEGLAAAPMGAVLAIGPGTYDEALRLTQPVTLHGACPGEVLLTSSVPDDPVRAGVVTVEAADIVVRNLSIGRSARPAIWAAVPSAILSVEDVVVVEADRVGVEVENGAQVTATNLIVRDTKPGPTGQFGRGLGVQSGATLEVRRAILERNHEAAAMALNADTSLLIEDAVLRDTRVRPSDGRDGLGLLVIRGASSRLVRTLVEGSIGAGVSAVDMGSRVELEDVVIRNTAVQPDSGTFGRGLNVERQAHATGRRLVVERSHEAGILVSDAGTELDVEDVIIADTQPRNDGVGGRGLVVQQGASARVSRIELDDNTEAGIVMGGAQTSTLTVEDLVVRRTRPGPDGLGRGFSVQAASLRASRVRIEGPVGVGIAAAGVGDSSLVFEDTRIRGTVAVPGFLGARAISIQPDATARFLRLALEDNAQYGILAAGPEVLVELEDLSISNTSAQDCAPETCIRGGDAIGAYDQAVVRATRFEIRGAALCGVNLAFDAQLDLESGAISSCTIGACVQVDGYDFSRLSADVFYSDNGQNLDAVTLPTPQPLSGLEL